MLKKISFGLAASAAALAFAATAYAAPLSGYAWSSNIGWISFNSSDGATVQLATTTGSSVAALSGYAWSPNIGWVEFGSLSGFPSSGSSAGNASVNTSSGNVTGWIRACAATLPGDCSSMTERGDGWDGWIELSGTDHQTGDSTGNSGVTYIPSNGAFVGYAWGGDVVGWLSFNAGAGSTGVSIATTSNPLCVNGSCVGGSPITASCTPSPSYGAASPSNPISVTWTTTGVSGGQGAPYAYQWSTYGGTTGGTASSQTYSLTGSYAPSVTVTDKSGGQAVLSCGAFQTSDNPIVSAPTVWINNPSNANDETKTTLHIRIGSSAQVDYALPSGTVCAGDQSDSGSSLSAWSGSYGSNSAAASGSVSLSSLPEGIYRLYLDSCTNNSQSTQGSNTVEIDVTPSTVQEE